ncbi:esterase 1 [Mycena leptocephala]|nr:esterase 1 [Mycena leptocephala]
MRFRQFTSAILSCPEATSPPRPRILRRRNVGIPYASPPIGELRFRAPVPKRLWSTSGIQKSSEDCLTINVFRPAGSQTTIDYRSWFGFSGEVFYTTLLRLFRSGHTGHLRQFKLPSGPLGFPVGSEAADAGLLNLGLKDQLTAFQWVQDNIGKFGGDRHKVTVFGESAGAVSIAMHFLNPEFKNLARAAYIFESGSAATLPTFPASHGQTDWITSCMQIDSPFNCLRTVNSSVLLNAFEASTAQSNQQYPWAPTIDGPGGILPDLPSKLFSAGQFARLPFIAGTNLDEASIIANYSLSSTLDIHLVEAADRLLELYPDIPSLGSPFSTGNNTFGLDGEFKRLAAITGDLWFQSQRRAWSQVASQAGVKTFAYLFTDPAPPAFPPYFGGEFNTTLLDTYNRLITCSMMDYWISFATSLDPNDGMGSDRPNWPEYEDGVLQLHSANVTVIPDDYRSEQIDFINENLVLFRH